MNTLFAKAPIKQVYFKLAFPVVLGMITTMVYNLVDTMFVAKTGDANLVAAVTISTPLINFLIAFSDILGLGGSSVISRLFGEKKYEEARRVSSFSIYAGIITSFILTAILFVFEKQILWLWCKSKYLCRCRRVLSGSSNWGGIHYVFTDTSKLVAH